MSRLIRSVKIKDFSEHKKLEKAHKMILCKMYERQGQISLQDLERSLPDIKKEEILDNINYLISLKFIRMEDDICKFDFKDKESIQLLFDFIKK